MVTRDMTAHAVEMRQIAAEWHGGQASALYAYASSGTIQPGLSREVRSCLAWNEGYEARRTVRYAERAANALALGRLLGHVADLEDRLNAQRACDESPTGWHEFVGDTCCHCEARRDT